MHLIPRAETTTTAPIGLPAYTETPTKTTAPVGLPAYTGNANTPNANDSNRGSAQHSATNGSEVHSGGWIGIAIGVIIVAAIVGALAYFIFTRLRARRLGLPPPSLNPFADSNRIRGSGAGGGGVVGWVKDRFHTLRRGRAAGGAYEGSAGGAAYGGFGGIGQRSHGRRSGFRGLDPDEAWDERVGSEADYAYEEQGVGLRDQAPMALDEDTGYERARYGPLSRQAPGGGDAVAEGRSELDERYDVETGRKGRGDGNVKDPFEDPPRPASLESVQGSRKSAFREGNMT